MLVCLIQLEKPGQSTYLRLLKAFTMSHKLSSERTFPPPDTMRMIYPGYPASLFTLSVVRVHPHPTYTAYLLH